MNLSYVSGEAEHGRCLFGYCFIQLIYSICFSQNMDPTQQAASQIIKGGTVTALTVSIKFCHAMPLLALRDRKATSAKIGIEHSFGFTCKRVQWINPILE